MFLRMHFFSFFCENTSLMLNLLIFLQNPIVKLFEKKHGWWLKINSLIPSGFKKGV